MYAEEKRLQSINRHATTERRLSYGHGRRVWIVSSLTQLVVAHTKQIQLGQFAWTMKEEN